MTTRVLASGAVYNEARTPMSARALAHARKIAACRSCGARPAEEGDGHVYIRHRGHCAGVIDKQDGPAGRAERGP